MAVQEYIRDKLRDHGYQEVHTPQVIDRSLWEKSGHWDKFGDMIFTTHSENRDYAIKPMNCPAHIQIYNHGLKSYRDLPLRLAVAGAAYLLPFVGLHVANATRIAAAITTASTGNAAAALAAEWG